MEDGLNSTGSNVLIPLIRYAVLLAPDFQRSPLLAAESRTKKSCLATTRVTSAKCIVLRVRRCRKTYFEPTKARATSSKGQA